MLDTKFWRKYFEVYDILNVVIPYQELMKELISKLEIKGGDFILDAGSGTGNLAIMITKKGGRVIGIDFSEHGVGCHKKKDVGAEVICCDLTKSLPFQNNYFDKIVSNNVLYTISLEKRLDVVKEFYRVLKPSGKIVISNVREGWKPAIIYKDAIAKEYQKNGSIKTLIKIIKLIIPTLRMLYYNSKIKKEGAGGNYRFMKAGEQSALLSQGGFNNISKEISVYSDQALLVGGDK